MRRVCVVAAVAGLMWMPVAQGQEKPARLTFEVATIKPSGTDSLNGGIKPLPGGNGYVAQNVTVKLMISLMYELPMRQITGGPGWLDSDRFDVEAKADHEYGKEELHEMFRNLLVDRFNLKFHTETKEGKIYALRVDKAGLKMAANPSPQDYNIPINYAGDGSIVGKRVPMKYFSWWLGQDLQRDERPVVDETGLSGNYDFTLTYLPERLRDSAKEGLSQKLQDRLTIFDALREQLGLDLRPEQGPVSYYVIDHINKPSDN
jgi:uncharacterized protein (TIGR03435 family)